MIRHTLDTLVFIGLFGLLAVAILNLPLEQAGLTAAAQQQLFDSGVDNPVTAVLLNFRSYDTMLEIGVLLLALIATWSVAPPAQPFAPMEDASLDSLVRLLVPVMIIGGGYILWIGSYAPGGAFQAGAMLAAALVVMQLAGLPQALTLGAQRGLLAVGLAVFLGAGLLPLAQGGSLLQYPDGRDKSFILAIEAAATVSIAVTLSALFAGGRPNSGKSPQLP
jgi:multisubunit Na+/H+ antiporter MnhB subunit